MGLNGNRFKTSAHSQPCPACFGYPPLELKGGRLVPVFESCDGRGSVPRAPRSSANTKSGSWSGRAQTPRFPTPEPYNLQSRYGLGEACKAEA